MQVQIAVQIAVAVRCLPTSAIVTSPRGWSRRSSISYGVILPVLRGSTWPDFTRSNSQGGRPRLLFSASIMTQVSKRNVAMSTAGYFFEPLVVFLAQLFDRLGGSLRELGMVFVFPRTGGGFQGSDLAQAHQLLFRCLGEKCTAPRLPTMVSISATSYWEMTIWVRLTFI